MPRFFVNPADISGETGTIAGEDARHLSRVLRIRTGEPLTVCGQDGFDYECRVSEVTDDRVTFSILSRRVNETEAPIRITLYQALPKGDKLDFIVQKAVEMGASRIVPVMTRFCVAKADAAGFQKKQSRYQKISFEAAKQCGRGIIPEVGNILTLDSALKEMASAHSLVFYEGGGERLHKLVSPDEKELSILIGSEGGFSEEEIEACRNAGVACATLGRRILRCETAPIAALALVMGIVGDM